MNGWLSAFILVSAGVATGQPTFVRPRTHEPKPSLSSQNELLDPDQSSVYMQFTKVGRCPMANQRQIADRVWLALKNNTRWTITVRANGVENACYGEASPFYRVEADDVRAPEGPIPYGHWFDVASVLEIEPGTALNFSVPKTDLDPGLSIRVDFEFTWEKNSRFTRHSSYFSYWDLPKTLHDKAKERS